MNGLHDMNVPHGRKLTWGFVLSTSYGLYRERFWALFRIGLPVALLTYLFTPFQRALRRLLLSFVVQHGWTPFSSSYWVLLDVLPFITGAVYWSLNALFLAGIAGNLITDDAEERHALSDAYSPVRTRLPALLLVALVTWIVYSLTREIVFLAVSTMLNHFHFFPGNIWSTTLVTGLPVLLILGLVSRAALAIPELIADSAVSPFRAIGNSISKTENWEPFFMFFMAKTAIAGYVIYWLAQLGFHELWNRTSISTSAYYWVTWAVYVCLFAMLESPLFIAFCVLYREFQIRQEEPALAAPAIG